MTHTQRDCQHGQLARSCNICELESERDALKQTNAELLEAAKKVLSKKRGEDDWLILAIDCVALEAAIARAEKGQTI